MGIFFFLRYGIASFAFAGWLLYQKLYLRKRWAELKPDAMAIVFFIIIWMGIAYRVMN